MFYLFRFFKNKSLFLLIISIFFTLTSAVFDIIQPVLLTYVVSIVDVINRADPSYIYNLNIFSIQITMYNAWTYFWTFSACMGIVAFFSLAFGLLASYTAAKASLLFTQNMRNACYNQVLNFSFADLDKFSVTSLITRLTNDAQKVQSTILLMITTLVKTPILMIGGLIVAFTFNWQMGLLIVGIIFILAILTTMIGMKAVPLFQTNQKAVDEASAVMRENALGMRVVKSFNLQEQQKERYNYFNKKLQTFALRSQLWVVPIISVVQFMLNFGVVLILLLGGFILSNSGDSQLSSEIFGLVSIMIMVLSSSVTAIISISMYIRTKSSIKRIVDVLETKPQITNKTKTLPFNEKNYDIEFNDVTFKYAKTSEEAAIEDINFKIKTGSTFGIIGSTGSGKSTIINLIPRLYDVTSGNIKIGGKNIKDLNINDLRKNIAVVLQEQVLFAGDIKYNLQYGKPDASYDEMIDACKQACAWDFVDNLPRKLEAPVEQRGRNFSGGQKQRLCLARAIIKKPKILILDDTTSALDLITEKTIQNNLNKNLTNCTKIIISERISSIKNADQIIVLDKGKIIGKGKHNELYKTNDTYRSIVNSQLGSIGG